MLALSSQQRSGGSSESGGSGGGGESVKIFRCTAGAGLRPACPSWNMRGGCGDALAPRTVAEEVLAAAVHGAKEATVALPLYSARAPKQLEGWDISQQAGGVGGAGRRSAAGLFRANSKPLVLIFDGQALDDL